MSNIKPSTEFATLYTGCQSRLYAFIYSLVGSVDVANDVLQDTNVVLWEKASEFDPGSSFSSWAFRVAYYEVLAMREKQGRDRLTFNDELLATMAEEVGEFQGAAEDSHRALATCIEKLTPPQQQLIRRRYAEGMSVTKLAGLLGRSANSISVTLYRLRVALMRCIEATLAKRGAKS